MGFQPGGLETRQAHAIFVVVDPDEVPGLRNALKRQKAGHSFDVTTRCGVGLPGDDEQAPLALIDVAIPEAGLALELAFPVDEYRHSLLEAVRSRQLTLMDPETSIALQSMPHEAAFKKGLVMTVPLADTQPIVGLLQQRIDLPLPTYMPEGIELNADNREEAFERFTAHAAVPDLVAVQYRETAGPSILIFDSDLPDPPDGYSSHDPLEGRWGAMVGEAPPALRLDTYHAGAPFMSWILANADERIVRAGAAGSHHVMLLRERLSTEQAEAERHWQEGISVWVQHVESLRAALLSLK